MLTLEEQKEEFLRHYGVKGMKWGVRRAKNTKSDVLYKTTATLSGVGAAGAISSRFIPKGKIRNGVAITSAILSLSSLATLASAKITTKDTEQGSVTPNQRKVIAGAAIISSIMGVSALALDIKAGSFKTTKISNPLVVTEELRENMSLSDYRRATAKTKLPEFEKQRSSLMQKYWTYGHGAKLTKSDYDLPEKVISQETKLLRFSNSKEKDSLGHKLTYASDNEFDFGKYVAQWGSSANGYRTEISLKAPVKVAKLDTVLDAYQKVYKVDREEATSLFSKVAGSVDKSSFDRVASQLKKMGYNAIYDHQDVGIVSDSPIVIFDSLVLGDRESVPITRSMVAEALSSLTLLSNPKE